MSLLLFSNLHKKDLTLLDSHNENEPKNQESSGRFDRINTTLSLGVSFIIRRRDLPEEEGKGFTYEPLSLESSTPVIEMFRIRSNWEAQ